MNDFFKTEFDDFELEHMPHVKALLIKHIIYEFEGETQTDENTLKNWLFYLASNNRLDELITAEWVYSESRHKRDEEKAHKR